MDETVLRIIYLIYLFLVVAIALFDWVYLHELLRVRQIIGIDSPPFITKLLRVNFGLSIILFVLLFLSLITDLFL